MVIFLLLILFLIFIRFLKKKRQQTYEEYLRDKGLGERPFNASNGGSPTVPKPKPAEDPLEIFKKKSDLFLQGSFGSSDKTFFNNPI